MAQTQIPDAGPETEAGLEAEQELTVQEGQNQQRENEQLAEEDGRPSKRQKLTMDKKNKRLITATNSKVGKVDLTVLLTQPQAWSALPFTTRQHLYSLLPAPNQSDGDGPHDPGVNPLESKYGSIIIEELQLWQEELKNGYETAKWRNEALAAGRERLEGKYEEGKYDEWKEAARKEQWGRIEDEENETPDTGGAELDGLVDEERGGDGNGSEIVVSKANVKAKRAMLSS